MESDLSFPRTAVVTFGSARAASRRVAGVAAAARVLRELAEKGVAEAWLVLPAGDALSAAAMADVQRVAGSIKVRTGPGGPSAAPGDILHVTGNRFERRGASAELLRGAGKPSDGPVSRWINRPISRRISELLLLLPGFTPLHATIGTALLAALMFAALVGGGEGGLIAGGLLFQAASMFDGVDGEVARVTFRSSRVGAVLDSAIDVATNLLFILGFTYNLGAGGNRLAYPVSAWGFLLFVLGLMLIAWRASQAAGPFSLDMVKQHYRDRFPGRLARGFIEFLTVVTSRDFFALLFALLILASVPMAVLYLFAAAATVWILFVLGSLRLSPGPALASRDA